MAEGPIRLTKEFFQKSGEDLSRALIGQILVRLIDGKRLAGRIVETEAYLGREDKAAHSYKGKTQKNTAMFMEPGTIYVYNIYGTYCCMNISSEGEGCAVLLRALEPLEGVNDMAALRWSNPRPSFKMVDLCNGPSKLCQSLSISKANFDRLDLVTNDNLWLERGGEVPESMIVQTKRVNIDYAEDWSAKPLRFYLLGNDFVSVKDKQAEKKMAGDDDFSAGDIDDVPLSLLRYGSSNAKNNKQNASETLEETTSGDEVKSSPEKESETQKSTVTPSRSSESSRKRRQASPEEAASGRKVTRSNTKSQKDTPQKDSSTLVSKDENSGVTPAKRGRGRPRKNTAAVAMKENKAVDNSEKTMPSAVSSNANDDDDDDDEDNDDVHNDDVHEDLAEADEEKAEENLEKQKEDEDKSSSSQPLRAKRAVRVISVPKGYPLPQAFFMCSSVMVAKGLLGQRLVRILDGRRISGKIVETEAYLGVKDKGSIAYRGKTAENAAMFKPPGAFYISSVYGYYFCFSICTEDDGGVVLLRSLEADEGRDLMMKNRFRKSIRDTEICNGPSKLCQALKIDKATFGNQNIATSNKLFIEREDTVSPNNIISTKRIITELDPEEWANQKLRFYVFGSDCVSLRDPEAEAPLKNSQYDLDQ